MKDTIHLTKKEWRELQRRIDRAFRAMDEAFYLCDMLKEYVQILNKRLEEREGGLRS